MPPLIDLHCHLDLYPDPSRVIKELSRIDAYVLFVTTTPKAWRISSKLAENSVRIRTALGLHPQVAHERLGELPLFEGLLPEAKYVGEIGLDGSRDHKPFLNDQLKAYRKILAFTSDAGGRVMSIHSRGAVKEVLEELERFPKSGIPILHWFSGTPKQLEKAIELGCWFSVGPAMLRGKKGNELLRIIPKNRLLTETDGPFALNGSAPFKPAEVESAISAISTNWGEDHKTVRKKIFKNFRILLNYATELREVS